MSWKIIMSDEFGACIFETSPIQSFLYTLATYRQLQIMPMRYVTLRVELLPDQEDVTEQFKLMSQQAERMFAPVKP